MNDLKCARMLFDAVERDLLTLQGMTAGVPEESFGFHAQQVTEPIDREGTLVLVEALFERLQSEFPESDET